MKIILLFTTFSAGLLVSCASNSGGPLGPYRPATPPEKVEMEHARVDVYPDQVRKDLDRYAGVHVAWAGIIVTNNATEDEATDKIHLSTLFDQRYFDWEQKGRDKDAKLAISPRGEGLFRMNWNVSRREPGASENDAMKYAEPGNLAIVYATPVSVGTNGIIELSYHYIRIFEPNEFTTNELDYGRLGEPIHPIPNAHSPSASPR